MIANFFNKTKPVAFFTVIVCLFVYLFSAALVFKMNYFSAVFFGKMLVSFLVIVLFLLLVKFIVRKNRLTQDNSYAVLLIVIILGTFYESLFNLNLLFANIILLLGFRKTYSLRLATNIKGKLFDAGLWVGVATLISEWSLLFLFLIYVAMGIYKRNNFKNVFIPFVGTITPIFIFYAYCLLINDIDLFANRWLFESSFNYVAYNKFNMLIPITFILTLMLWSIALFVPRLASIGVNAKRSWILGFNHLLVSTIIVGVSAIKNGSEIWFSVFPVAVIATNFLQKSPSKNFKNLILYLFFVISIVVYFL